MLIEHFSAGPLYTNAYFLTCEETGDCVLIDAPFKSDNLYKAAREKGDKLKYILLTHGHFDHILAAADIRDMTGAQICVHEMDSGCLFSEKESLITLFGMGYNDFRPLVPDVLFKGEENNITLGNYTIRVIHTPGHTKGGVCYLCGDAVFTGDTLFCGSMGCTDFPGGSRDELINSLRMLYLLPGDLRVFPGHGEETTLGCERETNPYMQEALNL